MLPFVAPIQVGTLIGFDGCVRYITAVTLNINRTICKQLISREFKLSPT